jgi:hypothetical protein
MSKRKGLSLEGKRDKVLEVFTESADVFVLKVRATRNHPASSRDGLNTADRLAP